MTVSDDLPRPTKPKRKKRKNKKMFRRARIALQTAYLGHYGTVHTHLKRFGVFCGFAADIGVKDIYQVDVDHVVAYGQHLIELGRAEATVLNAISSLNVVLGAATGRWQAISPTQATGLCRSYVRTTAPASFVTAAVDAAVAELQVSGMERVAAVVLMCCHLGVRLREALLADLDRWSREMQQSDAVNVVGGTKGGRRAPRWISLDAAARDAIEYALAVRPAGSRNMLRPEERLIDALRREIKRGRRVLKRHGIPHYHDLRAGYACGRYFQETEHLPPVFSGGKRTAPKEVHDAAMAVIMEELGHTRIDIGASYCGGQPRSARSCPDRKLLFYRASKEKVAPQPKYGVRGLLAPAMPGATVADHIRRGERIAEDIAKRWTLTSIRSWRLKHLEWWLHHGSRELSAATRYDYWRTVRAILVVRGKSEDWEPRLQGGPWTRRDGRVPDKDAQASKKRRGGRPPKLPNRDGVDPRR